MEIEIIKSREMDQNCYLIKKDGKGILIDPGLDTFNIIKKTEGIEINYILLTHCHFDHVYSLNEIKGSKTVLGSKNCFNNITNPKITLFDDRDNFRGRCDGFLKDGEERILEGIKVKCIYTFGHTDCSVCYLIEDCLFSGDTLFYKTIGRTDLPTGDVRQISFSIRNILYKLNDDTKVYPGHGQITSIGFEKKNNDYFKED